MTPAVPHYECAFRESPLWEGIPANLATAVERVEAHLAHQRTKRDGGVVDRLARLHAAVRDPLHRWHRDVGPVRLRQPRSHTGRRLEADGRRHVVLRAPENRLRDVSGTLRPVASQPLHCGVRQPAGSACFVCGEQVG